VADRHGEVREFDAIIRTSAYHRGSLGKGHAATRNEAGHRDQHRGRCVADNRRSIAPPVARDRRTRPGHHGSGDERCLAQGKVCSDRPPVNDQATARFTKGRGQLAHGDLPSIDGQLQFPVAVRTSVNNPHQTTESYRPVSLPA
jgi:hypothetical protein